MVTVYDYLAGKPDVQRQLGRPRRKWKDTAEVVDVTEITFGGWGGGGKEILGGHRMG